VLARTLGQKLGELLKQPVVVDNRAGAGGQIAAQAVAKSAADGATVLLGEVGSIAIAPAAYSKLPYDPARELLPVAEVVRSDFILVVPAGSPAQDVKAFIGAAKARSASDRVNFATFGAGTPGHFGAELLAQQAQLRIEPVHYRATGDAITALVAGDVQAAFVSTALAVPQVRGGKLRALATTAAAAAEQLGRQAVAAVQAPEVRQKLQEAGFTVTGLSRADTERLVKAEAQRWAGIVKASGFKAD
jgi:tripartite-type tricarboxylate transporter receptor subunit TctC